MKLQKKSSSGLDPTNYETLDATTYFKDFVYLNDQSHGPLF